MVLEERHLDLLTGRNEVALTLIEEDGSRCKRQHGMRIYAPVEMVRMMTRSGLTVEEAYGDLDGSDLTLKSHRLVLLTRK